MLSHSIFAIRHNLSTKERSISAHREVARQEDEPSRSGASR